MVNGEKIAQFDAKIEQKTAKNIEKNALNDDKHAHVEGAVPHFPAGPGYGEDMVKIPAAWLVEQAGFGKGFALGRAGISSRHTLAIINRGGATAAEVIALRDLIAAEVEGKFGIRLEQEPVMLGF